MTVSMLLITTTSLFASSDLKEYCDDVIQTVKEDIERQESNINYELIEKFKNFY